MPSALDLTESKRQIHSQHGEDGILETIFSDGGYFCEFGAWDGQHLSNTFALYEKGWTGCYIEGEPKRFEDLKRNITREGMLLVEAFVQPEGPHSLDAILGSRELDLLSIDIDSDDLAIWRSLKGIRPKVVVIEFNPTIPFDVRYVNPPGANKGNSALSIYEHAMASGYEMVAATETNLIFADRDFNRGRFRTFTLQEVEPAVRYFFGYDGTLMLNGKEQEFYRVPWSDSVFAQPLARPFRRFAQGSARNKVAGALSQISAVVRRPVSTLRHLIRG